MDSTTQHKLLAIIKARPEDAAEMRYRAALKTGRLVVASPGWTGQTDTWIIRVA